MSFSFFTLVFLVRSILFFYPTTGQYYWPFIASSAIDSY